MEISFSLHGISIVHTEKSDYKFPEYYIWYEKRLIIGFSFLFYD